MRSRRMGFTAKQCPAARSNRSLLLDIHAPCAVVTTAPGPDAPPLLLLAAPADSIEGGSAARSCVKTAAKCAAYLMRRRSKARVRTIEASHDDVAVSGTQMATTCIHMRRYKRHEGYTWIERREEWHTRK